jgi:ribonucleoside-diphosphate reductase alpha chain
MMIPTSNPSYSAFIHASRYARWLEDEQRRETWDETVNRYVGYWKDKGMIGGNEVKRFKKAIHDLDVVPSMRALMTAGPALDRDNVAGFNCAYLAINDPKAFDELMYILLCGTGVGFSVEREEVKKLPIVAEEFDSTDTTIVVADSKIGWAKSTRQLIAMLYAGEVPKLDYSQVRPAGARLKTFGGRASGPEPLEDLHRFLVDVFKGAAGRKLTDLECHDICCKIAEIVVVGGVRRSALISLSSPVSDRMQAAKSGQWWERNSQRALANNSAVYDEKPDFPFFMSEMKALYESYSGERGIFSREAARNIAGRNGRRDNTAAFGCNPCSEILLRPAEFCNLSEVIVRSTDTLDQLLEKVEVATAFGTLQATLTNFRYLRSVWKKNCEEEALLGVSLTGLMDHPVLNGSKGNKKLEEWLTVMRERAVNVNKQWAESLGINPAAAITCVKPSGTVSQLALCASGIHPNYSRYYVRTVRQDNKDPMTDFLRAQGVPYEPCVMKPDTTTVFSFPIEAPKTSIFRNDVGAIGQLEVWKQYQLHWCEHKPSITVYYKEDEFFAVCQWIWDNWDIMSGISLLPYDNGTYRQAPYQELTEQEYKSLSSKMPEIDWAALPAFERGDTTTGSQELACTGGVCEVVGSGA